MSRCQSPTSDHVQSELKGRFTGKGHVFLAKEEILDY